MGMFAIIRVESQAKYSAPWCCITDLGGEGNGTGHRSRPYMPREPCSCFACISDGGAKTGLETSVTAGSHTHTAALEWPPCCYTLLMAVVAWC